MRLAILQLVTLFSLVAPRAGAAPRGQAPSPPQVVNHNARIDAAAYKRPHMRGREKYREFLGAAFRAAEGGLRPGRAWIDSGGGFGLAGLRTAQLRGARVSVINAQDFWKHLEEGTMPDHEVIELATSLGVSFRGIPRRAQKGVGVRGAFTYWSYDRLRPDHYRLLRERALGVLSRAKGKGTYRYEVGFSEELLPGLRGKADLITDLYGAFFYSAGRAALLDLFYDRLKPGGVAVLRHQTTREYGIDDRVKVGGRSVPLVDYLISSHPEIFARDSADPEHVLVMRRDPGVPSLGLARRLVAGETVMTRMDDTRVPAVMWTARGPH